VTPVRAGPQSRSHRTDGKRRTCSYVARLNTPLASAVATVSGGARGGPKAPPAGSVPLAGTETPEARGRCRSATEAPRSVSGDRRGTLPPPRTVAHPRTPWSSPSYRSSSAGVRGRRCVVVEGGQAVDADGVLAPPVLHLTGLALALHVLRQQVALADVRQERHPVAA
jgi:hypothetical protein